MQHSRDAVVELHPCTPPAPVKVQAELSIGPVWRLRFLLMDPEGLVIDSLKAGRWDSWGRADELWKTTCFEAFWSLPGSRRYWELNLSPARRQWNLYAFESYREPQPPSRSKDFDLSDIVVTDNSLECRLCPRIEISALEASLTAIIRTANQTHFFAAKHAGPKADFHRRESFVLKRNP